LEAANQTEELEKLHEAFQSAIHYSDSESLRITGEASEAVYQELDEISTSTDSILDAAQTQTLQAEASQFVLEQNAEELICTDFRSQYFETIFEVLNNPWSRTTERGWNKLLLDPALVPLRENSDFQELLRKSLLYHFGYFSTDPSKRNKSFGVKDMPAQTATYLFHKMGWLEAGDLPVNIQTEMDWLRSELDVKETYEPNPIVIEEAPDWGEIQDDPITMKELLVVFVLFLVAITLSLLQGKTG